MSSPDGVTWTQRNSGTANGFGAVVYAGQQFVAVGGTYVGGTVVGPIATSTDGVTWTLHDSGTTNVGFFSIAYGNGLFVAVGGGAVDPGQGIIISSPDGINWVTRLSSATDSNLPPSFSAVAYGNGRFVALLGNYEATSSDGINWKGAPGGVFTSPVGAVPNPALTFGNGLFVATGGGYTNSNGSMETVATIYSSPDGINWTARTNFVGGGGDFFSSVTYGGGQFAAAGPTVAYGAVCTSSDGTNWISRTPRIGVATIGFGDGRFVGFAGTTVVRSGVIGKLGASLSPGTGSIQGTISGVTGQNYAIKASTNLAAWDVLTNVTINTNGLAQFSDPSTGVFRQRFYEALLSQDSGTGP
ncbi:MAG: hypothetical protein KGS61_10430 [Verrucomicrobia bacterium]|nr:hypothetical protein [Verrucomicrobiota bacterium]